MDNWGGVPDYPPWRSNGWLEGGYFGVTCCPAPPLVSNLRNSYGKSSIFYKKIGLVQPAKVLNSTAVNTPTA
jgi:hypothetical protein